MKRIWQKHYADMNPEIRWEQDGPVGDLIERVTEKFADLPAVMLPNIIPFHVASLARKLARGDIGRISIVRYVQMPVALGLGWVVFGESPPQTAILGGVVIALAGALVPLLPRQRRERAPT